MVNKLNIIRNNAGVAVALHAVGRNEYNRDVDATGNFHKATLGVLTDGTTTIDFPELRGLPFTFTLDTNPNDGDTAGKVAYDALAALLTHTTHAHGDPAPVIDDPLNAIRVELELLKAKLNAPVKVFDELKLEVYKENGKVIGHEWRLEMADNSDTIFAANAHIHGILPQDEGLPIVYIRYFDLQRNITAEVRARCATNHYAGFRYLLNGSAVSDQLYTGAEAETLLNLADQ